MLIRIEPLRLSLRPRAMENEGGRGAGACGAGTGCGFVDDALPRTGQLAVDNACRVAHRAGLRPQAPQPPTTVKKNLVPLRPGSYRDDNYCDAGGSDLTPAFER